MTDSYVSDTDSLIGDGIVGEIQATEQLSAARERCLRLPYATSSGRSPAEQQESL